MQTELTEERRVNGIVEAVHKCRDYIHEGQPPISALDLAIRARKNISKELRQYLQYDFKEEKNDGVITIIC